MITPGQVYARFDPQSRTWTRIRVADYTLGHARAHVEDADTGKRYRQILASSLHESATTRSGKPRRTGYVLEAEQPDA